MASSEYVKGDLIPDGEILYKYINPVAIPPGQSEIPNSIFEDKELSCDWKKFRNNPSDSFHIKEGKTTIISIKVCDEIRNPRNPKGSKGEIVPDWQQKIIYDPVTKEEDSRHGENKAHSLISGKKRRAVTDAIKRNSKII